MRADIVPGAVFPDYELTDHAGRRRKLSDLQGPDPMILVLGRGGFCPKDRRQAEGLIQLHHEMEGGYCRLVTITTDNLAATNEHRTGVGAHAIFVGCGPIVRKDLQIAEYTVGCSGHGLSTRWLSCRSPIWAAIQALTI